MGRNLPLSKETGFRKLLKTSSSWNPSCCLMYEKGSKRRALGWGDPLSLFPGILILCLDRKALSHRQPAVTDGPATNVSWHQLRQMAGG